jgi:hypothetical protein
VPPGLFVSLRTFPDYYFNTFPDVLGRGNLFTGGADEAEVEFTPAVVEVWGVY